METMTRADICFMADPWPPEPERVTLIFIHGSTMSKTFWEPQMASLSRQFNTMALDLPGHGQSPGDGFDQMASYTEAVMNWMEEVNPPGMVPCGLSLGGAVALDLMLCYPERFEAGILISTGARLRVMPLIFEAIKKDFNEFGETLGMAGISPANQSRDMTELVKKQVQCPAEVALKDFKACDAFDVMARLSHIQKPVLIISGNDDTTTPPKYADYLARKIPLARLEKIAGAAHLVPLEKPDQVNAVITDFLSESR
ncbi:MAG: alpha/beta fold hydrolase [Desulfosudaceae bacterium]